MQKNRFQPLQSKKVKESNCKMMFKTIGVVALVLFHLLTSLDPDTQRILLKVEQILFPIIYSVAGMALIFIGVKYGFKIHNEPEERAKHIIYLHNHGIT